MTALEFGNTEQIATIKLFRHQLAEQEKRFGEIEDGIPKQYKVEIEFSGPMTIKVWATSKGEAKGIADQVALDDALEPDYWLQKDVRVRVLGG